ncbi:amino acid ABC transporter substrate-binding protein [Prochlorococcus sp. MIT 1341]|uniref:amino acid ABC transporter substrate-binding protein n=1 Tax=Prochlorococcus sp. MIT 1341 TaxID=3096221 RepID=UPI002A765591|nr:amino acid ABC transporter substrate-binding protein [Prochlorococcus sp. MIT 1341]
MSSCASLKSVDTSRLDLIEKRNELICGVSGKIPGFSFLKKDGTYQGLDIDICRAMAAAILGSKEKVRFRPLTATERFTAIKTGEVDLLSRNTTFNLSRDSIGGNGLTFGPVVFHDGQGLMVKKISKIEKIDNLNGRNICVGSGTTTEQNLNDSFQEKNISYKPIKYQDLNQVVAGYLQGRCIAMTSDRSQLAAARSSFANPNDHEILDEVLSKEPLAPASIGNDEKFSDAIRWVIYALFAAEENGITQSNIEQKLLQAKNNSKLSSQRRFLGIDGELGNKLGLRNDFVVKVIKATGNYGEIYNRHLGKNKTVFIPRGLNNSYINGGLMIAPPLK